MFRTAADLAWLLATGEGETKRLSRAALETLAIVAYHQPVTRAEIEDIRGVAISKGTLDLLLETGWVRLRGRRRAPGRPITYGTTEAFLIHFGLEAIGDLPGLEDLRGAGLFEGRLPQGFGIPEPCDDIGLTEDEDPLEERADFVAGPPAAGPEKPAWHEDLARAKEALPAPEGCDF
jgi:segregation and condensation protein B